MRVPVICHVHEAEGSAPAVVRKALAAPLFLARHLVVNSRFSVAVVAGAWRSLGDRCTVVPNGVAGPPTVEPPREVLEGPVRLLYVGRLSERKGVADAVDAVGMLRSRGLEVTLDIVGAVYPGYEWVERDLRDRVATGELGAAVRFHGFDPDVWSHLAAADALVVPSRFDEPFGNTAVEGVLAARPVIASATSGLLEATDGYGSIRQVPPSSPEAIADAVARLVDEWPVVRNAAVEDARIADARHSPAAYRDRIAAIVRRFSPATPA